MQIEYPSRVDASLALLLTAAPAIPIALGLYLLRVSVTGGLYVIGTGVLVGAIIALLSIPCRYTLGDCILTIRCGLWREDIPLRQIRRVTKSRSVLSAPALSLQRVRITHAEGTCIISPRDRDAFMAELISRLPHPPAA